VLSHRSSAALLIVIALAAGCAANQNVPPVTPSGPAGVSPTESSPSSDASPVATYGPSSSPTPASSPTPPPTPVPAPLVYHGPHAQRQIALTFDDGYSAVNAKRIFDILMREHVPATFFPVALAVKFHPDIWRAIAAAGFPLADHTYSHRRLDLLSVAQVGTDIRRARTLIEGITGAPMLAILRPPGGYWNLGVREAAAQSGFSLVALWDIDTRDWAGPTPAAETKVAIKGGPGSIVLMHASLSNTPDALPGIIASYRARGFTFVTLGQMFNLPGPVPLFTKPHR
jgi:peptidoglycan/xylan/chitin deacetylase (PgdA/CDA1 family)